jgi:uncharacterized membrane protein
MQGKVTMKMQKISIATLASVLIIWSNSAVAYVGPGAGLSAIGSILAFFGVVVLMILGFFWYPVKRLINKKKSSSRNQAGKVADE